MDGRCGQAFPAFLENETADLAGFIACPYHEHVGNRTIGDPGLGSADHPAAVHLACAGRHAGRVGTVVRLGQAETAHPFATGEFRQVTAFEFLGAEGVDRQHDKRGLHAHHRAIARIDTLDLPGDQAVADVAQTGTAIFFSGCGAEQPQFSHLPEDFSMGMLMAEGVLHARQQFVPAIGLGRVAHHAFRFAELFFQAQRIVAIEIRACGRHRRFLRQEERQASPSAKAPSS